MRLGILDSKHKNYDAQHWCQLEALAKGGKKFKAELSCFLPRNPVEPADVYEQRKAQAHYCSYTGSITNLYTSWLFAASFAVKAYKRDTEDPIETDKYYGQFQENVGAEESLAHFMRERFRESLINHKSHILIELPSNNGKVPESKQEYDDRNLGHATLRAINRCDLFDYEEDELGQLEWAVIHRTDTPRADFSKPRNTTVETWWLYDRENVSVFQLTYLTARGRPGDVNKDIPQLGETKRHGFDRVPLITVHTPIELTIGEQTRDEQLEHFRRDNALSWLIRRTCYAQPVFNLEDPDDRPPTMGAGYAIVIGEKDSFGWTSPPQAPFDVLQKGVDAKRDEIYRIVHQMAQGLDNNAETVGRSADSKEIDAAATRIMLNAYGSFVSASIEEVYETISAARGEADLEWSVEGFDGYDTATAASLLAAIQMSREMGIPSVTFQKEVTTKAALALIPGADQRVKDSIRKEISDAKFDVSSTPLAVAKQQLEEARIDLVAAQAELNRAKSVAEPVKATAAQTTADASMITAKKPTPKPPGSFGK